jgi:oxygen-independent coproporphyrinogen-3 oxidase
MSAGVVIPRADGAPGTSRLLGTPPLGLYVHIPWCVRKCPYCDFNSYAERGDPPERAYVDALLADLEQDWHSVPGRTIETVFIGGGTPSLFSAEAIDRLLQGIARVAVLAADAEITLEANPGTVDAARFKGFRAAGVNRLSIGIQSFDDESLRAVGRIHGGAEAIRAVHWARDAGFENLNLDLMFGLPGQTPGQAIADIEQAVALEPSHVSYYHLTLEPNTAFYKRPPLLPDEDEVAGSQERAQGLLAAAGYRQYEVSAYARPGFQCRHNLNYWRHGDYLGIGAGAHGKLTDPAADRIVRTARIRQPEAYLTAVVEGAACAEQHEVPQAERALEFLMNQLRLREGFPEAAFPARTGLPLTVLEPQLSGCIVRGLLVREGNRVRCTELGWRFLDEILGRFVD